MALKTDYKDDAYEGKRKYLLIDNGDGTYSFDDVTNYKVEGDYFNGYDINTTNKSVNSNTAGLVKEQETRSEQVKEIGGKIDSLKVVRYATFPESGWSDTAPYTQTVNVAEIEASDTPIVSLYIPPSTAIGSVKAISKSYGCVDKGVTGDGTITLYCYNSRPSSDFQIMIKGE